jgi:hypothetical protein
MNDREINKIVEDTLESIDGINLPAPDEHLFGKIMNGYNKKENSFIKKENSFGKYAIAFAVLILINIFSFINYHKDAENKSSEVNQSYSSYSKDITKFANECFSYQTDYNYNIK